jgi:hypothetical protein
MADGCEGRVLPPLLLSFPFLLRIDLTTPMLMLMMISRSKHGPLINPSHHDLRAGRGVARA